MKGDIEVRSVLIAEYLIKTSATVRQAAKEFGVGKTTVHTDITKRLPKFNKPLADQAYSVLEKNGSERHLRGGVATRNHYAAAKKGVEIHV